MKSIQVLRARYTPLQDKENYSDLIVLRSIEGYYIGTLYNDPVYGTAPGSRDTSYLVSKSQAELALRTLQQTANDMPGQPEERIIENWEHVMENRHNIEIYYRWNP